MQVQKISNQNNALCFQGKGSLKKLTNSKIKIESTPDSVTLTNKSNDNKVEILTFPKEVIKELQEIAQKIYARKRYERSLSSTK